MPCIKWVWFPKCSTCSLWAIFFVPLFFGYYINVKWLLIQFKKYSLLSMSQNSSSKKRTHTIFQRAHDASILFINYNYSSQSIKYLTRVTSKCCIILNFNFFRTYQMIGSIIAKFFKYFLFHLVSKAFIKWSNQFFS